jgi:DNA-binding LacI/PurR family transcriptional regulator
MGITIKELSELSGYSPATISRVITNKGNVKEETRIEIQRLLAEYDYRTSVSDMRKSMYREKIILLLIGDIANQFYTEQIACVSEAIRKNNYIAMVGYCPSRQEEEDYVRMAIDENYAGLIFFNVKGSEQLSVMLNDSKIPVAFLNRTIRHTSFDSVSSDNYQGGFQATSYLIERGHRRIAHLAGSVNSHTTQERARGYETAMREHDLVVSHHNIYYGNLDRESGYKFGEVIVKEHLGFTAVFCGNDLMADGLMTCFKDYGIRVPEDISIVCYDNTVISRSLNLTVISSNPKKMGERAVELLLHRIHNQNSDKQSVLFSPVIISGKSVLAREM